MQNKDGKNVIYVVDAKTRRVGHGVRSHSGSSLAGVLDQGDGIAPLRVGQAVQVFAESQTVLKVCLKVAGL